MNDATLLKGDIYKKELYSVKIDIQRFFIEWLLIMEKIYFKVTYTIKFYPN